MLDSKEQLFRVLVGVAWIDGEIQPQEQEYLQNLAVSKNLNHDPVIQDLLSVNQPVSIEQCYQWLDNYLGDNPTKEDCYNLITEIAALIYCDDNVDVEEAKILTIIENYHSSNPRKQNILKKISDIYRKVLNI